MVSIQVPLKVVLHFWTFPYELIVFLPKEWKGADHKHAVNKYWNILVYLEPHPEQSQWVFEIIGVVFQVSVHEVNRTRRPHESHENGIQSEHEVPKCDQRPSKTQNKFVSLLSLVLVKVVVIHNFPKDFYAFYEWNEHDLVDDQS